MDPAKREITKKTLAEILAEEDRRFFRQPQVNPPLPTYLMGSIKGQTGPSSANPTGPSAYRPSIPTSNYYSALVSKPKTPEKK